MPLFLYHSAGLSSEYRKQQRPYSLNALDEAGGLLSAGVEVQGGVVVAHPEGYFDALRIDEVHAACQRNSSNPGGGRGEGAERAWEVLHVFSTLDIVHIGASELVI